MNTTEEQLYRFIALGEGFTTEFKRVMPSELGREICSFANTIGGVILLGVADDGAVCGVSGHNLLESDIQSIARSTVPSITVEVDSVGEVHGRMGRAISCSRQRNDWRSWRLRPPPHPGSISCSTTVSWHPVPGAAWAALSPCVRSVSRLRAK